MKPVQSLKYYWLFTKARKVLLVLISITLLKGQLQETIQKLNLFGYGLEINGNNFRVFTDILIGEQNTIELTCWFTFSYCKEYR